MKSASLLFLTLVLLGCREAQAQTPTPAPQYPTDWTTNDGEHLHNVKVLKVDSDFVTVMHSDGGGIIPLSSLTPDLQKLFNYPHKYMVRRTAGGIRYKDIVVGSGLVPSPNDQITVTLKPNDSATTEAIKAAVDAETKRLEGLKAVSDKDLMDAQTSYGKTTDPNAKQTAYVDLQNAQKKSQDLGVKLDALLSNTFTFSFGGPDIIPGLGEVVSNMKSGGKRDVNPLPPPPPPSEDDTPTPTPSPTPTPTPAPVGAPPPPPKFSYEVDVIDLQPANQ